MGGESRKLGEDIIKLCILPRLPTKDLLRFQCVSRSWHSLISRDPYFTHLHSQSISSSILFMESQKTDGKFREEFISRDPRSSGFPSLPFPIEVDNRIVLASCNGLLCLKVKDGDIRKLYIGNPILRDWRLLPHLDFIKAASYGSFGLAVDVEKSGVSYKLVVPYTIENDDDKSMDKLIFNVLSSRYGQWEVSKYKLDVCKWRFPPQGHATYLNGVLYWVCHPQMLWLDTKDGRNGLFSLPSDTNHDYSWKGAAGVCNGEMTYTSASNRKIEIWSAADHQSSWTKIHSICIKTMVPQNSKVFGFFSWKIFGPLFAAVGFEGGNVVFFHLNESLFSYDMETGVVEMKLDDYRHWLDFLPYKHCLTPSPNLSSHEISLFICN